MKRLLIAVALLALTAGLCIGGQITLERRVERLLNALEDVEVVYLADGAQAAHPYVTHLLARIDEETRLLPLFLPHDRVDAVAESACPLPALLDGDAAAFTAQLLCCRDRLEQLQESERLSAENLL